MYQYFLINASTGAWGFEEGEAVGGGSIEAAFTLKAGKAGVYGKR